MLLGFVEMFSAGRTLLKDLVLMGLMAVGCWLLLIKLLRLVRIVE